MDVGLGWILVLGKFCAVTGAVTNLSLMCLEMTPVFGTLVFCLDEKVIND